MFAETSEQAWLAPNGLLPRMRQSARRALLRVAALKSHRPNKYVRCLYSHAVFGDTEAPFRAFIEDIKQLGGTFVDTPTLLEFVTGQRLIDDRYFHLSFDDGLANVFEVGGRILHELSIPYTIFIATDLISGEPATTKRYFQEAYRAPVRTMDWEQVNAAAETPLVEIGCHTRSHPRLSAISLNETSLRNEISGAKEIIEQATGRACRSFAWPYGNADAIDFASLQAIRDAGFECCFSAVRGRVQPGVSDLFQIPRHQVEFHWQPYEMIAWAKGYGER